MADPILYRSIAITVGIGTCLLRGAGCYSRLSLRAHSLYRSALAEGLR